MSQETQRPFNVLFLCTGNSARSIMAEAIMNRVGAGRFKAYSAGSHPSGQVNPHALALLRRLNHGVDGLRSKPWDEFSLADNPDAPKLDFVFTVCDNAAGEMCPVWPGQPMTAHWGIEDPAAVQGTGIQKETAFVQSFRYLKNRIGVFTSLPLRSVGQLALGAKLREIGQLPGATGEGQK
jgi:arsenate reductase